LALHCWCGSVCDNTTLWKLEAAVYDRLPLILLNTKDNIKAISVLLAVGFIGSELVSLGLALLIFRTLRKNVAFFSAKTYRMHVQMTTLIVLQVCLYTSSLII
jgi:hypothetical protein